MAHDRIRFGGQDRTRINVHEDYELRDWSKKLGLTAKQLKPIQAVGPTVPAVKGALGSQMRSKISTPRGGLLARRPPTFASAAAACAFVSGMGLVLQAVAQPTGNPTGTVAPLETSAPKPSASSRERAQGSNSGKLVGTDAQTRARMQGAKPAGGGTEGGLQRREANDPSQGGAARSGKGSATVPPLPPSK